MKKIRLLYLLTLLTPVAFAQSNLTWAKKMGSIGSDAGTSIALDNSGNVYTTGYFTNTADFDPGAGVSNMTSEGMEDIFISKMNSAGDLLWAIQIGGTDGDRGYSIATDASGNVYATGAFIGTADFDPGAGVFNMTSAAGYGDMFIVKLNTSGNLVWAKQYGGTGSITGYSIALDASGNIHTTGSFVGAIDFDPGAATLSMTSTGTYDIFVSKLNSFGDFIWAKQMGGTSGFENNISNSITVDGSGNVYTTGAFEGTTDFDPGAGYYPLDSTGFFICKLNAAGDLVWAKSITSVNVTGNSMTTDNAGNLITTGSFAYNADFDMGAGTYMMTTPATREIFILKTDPSGNLIWAKQMGSGISGCYGYGVITDANNHIYTTGSFSEATDFDPGSGTAILTSNGAEDIFISRLDASGNYICAQQMGGIASDYGYSVALDPSLNIYTTGAFSDNVDFDPGSGTYNLSTEGYEDIFVTRITDCSVGVGQPEIAAHSFSIFPNPSRGIFYIQSDNLNPAQTVIDVYGPLGEYIKQLSIDPNTQIDLSDLCAGIYLLKINVSDQFQFKKIIIQ
jgi:type IX secretion system substrate protein/beta-propeller repeat-containing protein